MPRKAQTLDKRIAELVNLGDVRFPDKPEPVRNYERVLRGVLDAVAASQQLTIDDDYGLVWDPYVNPGEAPAYDFFAQYWERPSTGEYGSTIDSQPVCVRRRYSFVPSLDIVPQLKELRAAFALHFKMAELMHSAWSKELQKKGETT